MRMGVVDFGANAVRLVIANADGEVPLPVHTGKWRLRLSEHLGADGTLGREAVLRLSGAASAARAEAERWGVREPFAFATAVVRDAPNCPEILADVHRRSGLRLRVLPGEVEAELTFLAARRWMGWRAGSLAVLDIGGGTFEIAFGRAEVPEFAASLPLGARRLTRDFFGDEDPPPARAVKAVRRHVRRQLRDVAPRIRWEGPRTAVATSRTFQQLARLCGAAPGREGPFVPRELARRDLRRAVAQLGELPAARRAELPGISTARSLQCLAGAVVADTVMKMTGIRSADVCPWALREGILLRATEDRTGTWWTGHGPSAVCGTDGRARLRLAASG
ncbi:Ppx/GppA family phosphatase [Streptomyces sp. GC420]|uniref:Ppx/GppA phosphatase family protein n=1 Tax=Streptomyces sp. GC420 TaxID=2697568 RepID=UPI0014150C10|nr:Ppx/GppA family phosphatase [Streptomyces sp. GC420]NBM16917.1 Ppx/GppA family phosphatase [Streptomyces sp. GC420]